MGVMRMVDEDEADGGGEDEAGEPATGASVLVMGDGLTSLGA